MRAFGHDKNCNVTDDEGGITVMCEYFHDSPDRLLAAPAHAGSAAQSYSYDSDSREVRASTYFYYSLNRCTETKYDRQNRLMQASKSKSSASNGTTSFYYDGWRVMEEHDGSDKDLRQYTYGSYLE